ncbi:unnamed protein product, partial [Scytosiphon promiscuus]
GKLEPLQCARENGCVWNYTTSFSAARGGHLAVLKWAGLVGSPWASIDYPAAAAAGGHLWVLQWLFDMGCTLKATTCASAAEGGHVEALRRAKQEGCPWDGAACAVLRLREEDTLPF